MAGRALTAPGKRAARPVASIRTTDDDALDLGLQHKAIR
jgi:hypothetical protein